ncbi:trypsin-like peptidase domain-containing protein [Streptomyces sp. NPDC053427]|uniref:trypsin-like peptidase domain-containing protein n=1 Tax=Streptomyces sp. NPDC053427 TaxID=3365701 RepID=UPI0037CCEAB2
MDDGKAAGPKLKWWSRPGRPVTQPPTEAAPQAPAPPADRTAGTAEAAETAAGAPGVAGTSEDGDWTVRPPEGAGAEGADAAPGPSGPEPSAAAAVPEPAGAVKAADATGTADTAGTAEAAADGDWTVRPPDGEAAAPEPSTVTPGQVGAAARDDASAGSRAEAPDGNAATATVTAGAHGAPERPRPLHAEDPYGTPPYGGPGPWAPAPPVQRPMATPAQGTRLPPYAMPAQAPMPGAPYPGPAPQPPAGAAPSAPAPTGDDRPSLRKAAAPQEPAATPSDAPDTTPFVPHPGDGGPRPATSRAAMPGGHGPAPAPAAAPAPVPAPAPLPAPTGAWQQYDPWSAPQHGGPAMPPPPGSRRTRRAPLVAGAVALALLAGGVGGVIGAYIERYGGINDIQLTQAADDGGARNPDSVAGIAQRALPGVVTLHVRGSAEQGTGTGFVLDREGHILTNNHVVEPAGTGGEISVTFSGGQTAKAKVVGQDGGYDLAVVQVEGVTGLRPLTLGNSDAVRVGDPVVAIGAPYDLANTVTSGIISAKQRPITAGGRKGDGSDVSYVDALQTDAPINPGNSGGPLVDAKARVIGINSAIRAADSGSGADAGGQGGSIGLGFAIPINQAKRVAEELINTGRATHPVIGVTLEMEYAGDGARVSARSKDGKAAVTPGGPGAKAGIRAGDVITKVDGAAVHSGEELIVKVRSHRPGDTLVLSLQRSGKERTVRLTLGSSSGG